MILRVTLPFSTALLSVANHALAWNDKGHIVVTKLAWRQLTPEQRTTAARLLKAHPHYEEYLSAKKPDRVELDTTPADWSPESYGLVVG